MVTFIFHLSIFVVYLSLKIWDCAKFTASSLFYKIFVFLELNGLICGFLLFLMQSLVFSFLNFRLAKFDHHLFVFSFLISLAYVAVFFISWLFTLFRLLGNQTFFASAINKNAYYYFFVGYKDHNFVRTWDHWMALSHAVCAFAFGILIEKPLP